MNSLMRLHLIKIFESGIIQYFPQDPQYGISQKVLPLAVVKAREAEAAYVRMIYQCETEQQKLNRLEKARNICQSKKELNNKLRVQGVPKEFMQMTLN